MKNIKILWGVIAILLFALSTIGYKLIQGDVAPSEDNRIAVNLSKDERNLVLNEMRNFLISTQAVSEAITNKDLKLAAKLASEAGMQAEKNAPGSLLSKIPLAMKTLGFDTRQKFDQIALDALQLNDPMHSRNQLEVLMKNCIACHASFKILEVKK
jgi:KaiC/GvpD/RAD55 family RecA-like ATPase